jgi:magnesium chelatase subunit I
MTDNTAGTIGELKASGYRPVPIREEMRRNLMAMIREKKEIFPGIIGYDDTVIPQIENAVISGQDIIFLGERGQAKSRIMRALVQLLDEETPVIAGCEINDDPFAPVCRNCRDLVAAHGDDTEIAWLRREERYGEKLATPDIAISDLIGDVDPIKVAEGRYLSDELTIHYGLIPRTNHGIFCINELPDLTERLQVGLFNLMEERDIQIRGYRIHLPLDIFLIASANPEDYTNRGRIVTPLKDRFGAQIRTHYPTSVKDEMIIMETERRRFAGDGIETIVPAYMKEIIAEVTHQARHSPDINQRSGVSVRVSISNYETMLSNAIRRAAMLGEKVAVPRVSDLDFIRASTSGKVEIDSFEEGRDERLIEDLIKKSVLTVFNRRFQGFDFEPVVDRFNEGFTAETSPMMDAKPYLDMVKKLHGLDNAVAKVNATEAASGVASAVEFILEGLHLNRKLNKTRVEGRTIYRR